MENPLIALIGIVLFIFMSLWGFRYCWEQGRKFFNYLIRNSKHCQTLEKEIENREDMILNLREDLHDIETRFWDSIYQ